MLLKTYATIQSCLLGTCKTRNNMQLVEYVTEHIFELDPKNDAPYVFISNIFAAVGKRGGIEKVWKMLKDRGIEKTPNWIETNNQVHAFFMGDNSHQE